MVPSSFKLSVGIMKQGKRYVAHSPALDISTSGTTEKQARKRFEEMAGLFFEELSRAGTTEDVLAELGWKKIGRRLTPPVVAQSNLTVRIPSFA